ncbi:hypothetical protein DFH08DRAFT_898478 [Mycena albidolilacea]|uniref:SWIM-type domain-containing protein n=1 Tax=Mycena albidolilacea TaxID=1033008 RepID=A0AAD6Z7G4_9AGAR|nr:hypothetical protein DFH08DRAFT_898478 [Mycena albidolilacea]
MITDDFSLDSTLLNTEGPNGTLRAATTVLCTANEAKHVTPGVYLISANIKARTIKGWFVETIRKLEARSREISDDETKILYRDATTVNRLFNRGQHIAVNGFDFMNINIDKSRSEYNGITEALRELGIRNYCIRLCQFHVVFAILRFDFDDGAHGLGFSVPVAIKAQILVLFRILQRCRSRDRWGDAKHAFYAGLQALLGDVDTETMAQAAAAEQAVDEEAGSTSQSKQGSRRKRRGTARPRTKAAKAAGRSFFEVVKEYFDKNWFIEPWIDSFTDIGMPPGQSRDDTWNTNNFAETAFKQFNAIFMGNKHNKRTDQLASIILNHHLPFFRFFPTPDRPLSKELVALHHSANRLWETEMVDATTDTETFTVSRIDARKLIKYTVVLSPLSCTCNHYQQTGNACVDIIAARLMRSNGPAKSWKDVEARTEKTAIPTRTKRGGKGHRAQKLLHDETVFSEVTNSFEKLRAWEEEERSNELEPSFGEFQLVTSSGRPANAKPLRPWRRKQVYAAADRYGYSPRFVKKRGPAKRSRLHWNSLLPAFRRNNNPRRAAYMHHIRQHAMLGVLALNNVDAASESVQNPTTTFNIQTNISATSGEFAAPNDNDEFLNAEDHALTQLNGLQWINDDYELRLDEMGVFLAFFNACSIAIDNGIIFLCGGVDNPFATALRSMDWTQPLSVEQLRQGHMSVLADLVASRRNNRVKHIIFFDVRYHHWTTFYHSLATNPPALSWFNTPRQPDVETPTGDIQDQIVLHQFFLRFRPQGPPMQVPVPLHPIYLARGLQQDSYTCGFWVVYLGLLFLLDFEPINSAARDLNIKELVCPIYIAFLADEHGVPVSLLYNLLSTFRPQVDLSQLPPDTIDCGIYAILSSICLASMLDLSLATHTARIHIANRLNQAIRSCDQNAEALRQSVSRVPTPTAPSQRHSLRGRFPRGDPAGFIVFFRNPLNDQSFVPAKKIGITGDSVRLEWYCDLVFVDENQKPRGEFTRSKEDWKKAWNLAPIMWPAQLRGWSHHLRLGSHVFPSDRDIESALEQRMQELIRLFCGEEAATPLFVQMGEDLDALAADPNSGPLSDEKIPDAFESFALQSFNLLHIPLHEEMVYSFSEQFVTIISSMDAETIPADRHKAMCLLAETLGPVWLCIAYVHHQTAVDEVTVYEALKDHRVEWPQTESEVLLELYRRMCGENLGEEDLQIMVPELPILGQLFSIIK